MCTYLHFFSIPRFISFSSPRLVSLANIVYRILSVTVAERQNLCHGIGIIYAFYRSDSIPGPRTRRRRHHSRRRRRNGISVGRALRTARRDFFSVKGSTPNPSVSSKTCRCVYIYIYIYRCVPMARGDEYKILILGRTLLSVTRTYRRFDALNIR